MQRQGSDGVWEGVKSWLDGGTRELWEKKQEVDLRPGCRRPWALSEGAWVFSCEKQEAVWRTSAGAGV